MPRVDLIQYRRDTTANWAAVNPILAAGEPGVDLDLDVMKIGDGVTSWVDLPVSGLEGPAGTDGTDARRALAGSPDLLVSGAITRDANGAATSAAVIWPDGTPGTYTATTVSTAFPGAVDAYTITYGSPVTKTYTQAAVTRNTDGAVATRPTITES